MVPVEHRGNHIHYPSDRNRTSDERQENNHAPQYTPNAIAWLHTGQNANAFKLFRFGGLSGVFYACSLSKTANFSNPKKAGADFISSSADARG
jgi:hypothetical protein